MHPAAGILVGGVGRGLTTMLSRARSDRAGIAPLERISDNQRHTRVLDFLEGFVKGAAAAAVGAAAGPLAGATLGAALGPVAWNRRRPLEASGNLTAHRATGVEEAWKMGVTGKGVTIVVMDTGLFPHGDLKDRLLAFHDFSNPHSPAHDPDFHGTFCAGIAAGDGSNSGGEILGVAPEANLIGLKVDDEDGFDYPKVLKALEWIDQNRKRYNIQVVNMSFGLGSGQKLVADAIEPLARKGVIFCTSAGNGGPYPRRLDVFKTSPHVLTAACLDNRGTESLHDDRLADLSSRPPEGDANGPDVAVAGTDVAGTDPNGGYRRLVSGGTSFSSAYLAGAMALWKQARPQMTVDEARELIEVTSTPLEGTPEAWQGAGQLQVAEGLRRMGYSSSS